MMMLFTKKLRRDLAEHWTQFVAVAVMAALSVLIFSGLEGGWRGIDTHRDKFAHDNGLPTLWVGVRDLTDEDVARIDHQVGVIHTQLVTSTMVEHDDSDLLLSSWEPGSRINVPQVTAGHPIGDASGVWLDDAYADAHGVTPGDTLTVTTPAGGMDITVQGLIIQPDKMAYTGRGFVAPDRQAHGYGVASADILTELTGHGAVEHSLTLVAEPQRQHAVEQHVREALGDRLISLTDRDHHPHVATVFERANQIRSLSILFSSLFVLVALLSIFTSVRRLTDIQRTEVATLRALGHSHTVISVYYTVVGIVAVAVGCGVGVALAPVLSRYVLTTQQGSFSLPTWEPTWSWVSALVPVALLGACVVASWTATLPMRTMTPAEGMRPSIGRARRAPLERWPRVWERLTYGDRWAIRDAMTNPVRVLMGIVAAMGAMMLLFAGFGMPDTLTNQVRLTYDEQYQYSARVGVAPQATETTRRFVEATSGTGQWMAQQAVTLSPDATPDTLTVLDDGTLFQVHTEQGEAITLDDAVVITEHAASRHDVTAGDDLTLTFLNGDSTTVTITHVVPLSEPQGVIMSDTTWRTLGHTFTPTTYLTQHTPPGELQENSAVTSVITLAEQRANAHTLINSLTSVFTLMKLFAVGLTMVVLYNLGALSFTERIRDYATLRVLGFHHSELRSFASRENVFTTLTGWLLGIPAGWWFLNRYVGLFTTDRAAYQPSLSMLSFTLASAMTIMFALTATLLLTRRISGIDMTSALKGVE